MRKNNIEIGFSGISIYTIYTDNKLERHGSTF